MIIKFKTDEEGFCLTTCPIGKSSDGREVNVSSISCQSCRNFRGFQSKSKIICEGEIRGTMIQFENEEEARKFYNDVIWIDINGEKQERFIVNLKEKGYIKQMELDRLRVLYIQSGHNPGTVTHRLITELEKEIIRLKNRTENEE